MPPEMITNVAPTAITAKKLASVAVCTSVFELRKLFTSSPVRRSTCAPANRVRMPPRSRITMARPAGGEVRMRRTMGRTRYSCPREAGALSGTARGLASEAARKRSAAASGVKSRCASAASS